MCFIFCLIYLCDRVPDYLHPGKAIIKTSARPDLRVDEMLGLAKGGKGSGTVQLFSENGIINRLHLEGAYANAVLAFEEGTNRAREIPMEMMLYAAMTGQIEDALETCGAADGSRIIVFADSTEAFNRLKGALGIVQDWKPDKRHAAAVSKRYGIKPGKGFDEELLERMALSRLRD